MTEASTFLQPGKAAGPLLVSAPRGPFLHVQVSVRPGLRVSLSAEEPHGQLTVQPFPIPDLAQRTERRAWRRGFLEAPGALLAGLSVFHARGCLSPNNDSEFPDPRTVCIGLWVQLLCPGQLLRFTAGVKSGKTSLPCSFSSFLFGPSSCFFKQW